MTLAEMVTQQPHLVIRQVVGELFRELAGKEKDPIRKQALEKRIEANRTMNSLQGFRDMVTGIHPRECTRFVQVYLLEARR